MRGACFTFRRFSALREPRTRSVATRHLVSPKMVASFVA